MARPKKTPEQIKKEETEFLAALKAKRGVIKDACNEIGISESTIFKRWYVRNPDFKIKVQEVIDSFTHIHKYNKLNICTICGFQSKQTKTPNGKPVKHKPVSYKKPVVDLENLDMKEIDLKEIGQDQKLEIFLKLFQDNHCSITKTCNEMGIFRSSYYHWMDTRIDFKNKINLILNNNLDFVQDQLFDLISRGDRQAIMFYLKTKGAKSGYSEKTEIKISGELKQDLIIKPYLPNENKLDGNISN
jgi:hypothetical protein